MVTSRQPGTVDPTGMVDTPLRSATLSSIGTITGPALMSRQRRTNIEAGASHLSVSVDRRKGC